MLHWPIRIGDATECLLFKQINIHAGM